MLPAPLSDPLAAPEQYKGKVTPVGNSRGIRLDAAFFRAHPEFSGEVRATVLANGHLLLSTIEPVSELESDPDTDPLLSTFLKFLEQQISQQPDLIEPADPAQLARIAALVEGVEVDN